MIKNLFYVLTILAAGATAYFGSVTKNKVSEEIATTVDLFEKNQIVADNIETKDGEIVVAKDEKRTAEDARAETEAELDNETGKERPLRTSLADLETQLEDVDAELETINGAIATAKAIIRDLLPDTGADLNIDAVVGHIEDLQNQKKENEVKLEDQTLLAGKLADKVDADSTRKSNLQGRLGRIKNRISLNGVSASVSGVSNEYGFVIINRGANNSNLDETSKLLVSRGGRLIARLKVAQIEPTQTICDIIPTSIKVGQRLRNGDRVTIEEPVTN